MWILTGESISGVFGDAPMQNPTEEEPLVVQESPFLKRRCFHH